MLAITNRHLCNATDAPQNATQLNQFLSQLKKISTLDTPPVAIILREKDLSAKDYQILAEAVLACNLPVPVILHTFVDVALALNHPAIHLPLPLFSELSSTSEGLIKLSKFKKIGTSIHSAEDAEIANHLGATYVLAGNVYETDCKKGLAGRGLNFIQNVSAIAQMPIYALGGITSENVSECIAHGALDGAMMSRFMK